MRYKQKTKKQQLEQKTMIHKSVFHWKIYPETLSVMLSGILLVMATCWNTKKNKGFIFFLLYQNSSVTKVFRLKHKWVSILRGTTGNISGSVSGCMSVSFSLFHVFK